MMKIIRGSTNHQLASRLGFDLVDVLIERFEDGELKVQLGDGVLGEDVVIVQSTNHPSNDNLMELLLLIDAAKQSGASSVTALVPYLGYSRQDKPSHKNGSIPVRLVANLIEAAGANHLVTIDLHSSKIEKFFKIGIQNIETASLFAKLLKHRTNLIIVSPDKGGEGRAKNLSHMLGTDFAVINKVRMPDGVCEMIEITGNVTGKHCVIVDDIVDTGETICKASELLMQKGALSVEAFATHAVLSGKAIANIKKSLIEKLTVTNSIEKKNLLDILDVVDVSSLLISPLKK